MRRLLAASSCALALAGQASAAAADKGYKVAITSTPAGAELRVGDRTSDPLGKTPWVGSLPAGNHMVILNLADHHEVVDEIVVAAAKKAQKFAFELQAVKYGRVDVLVGPGVGIGGQVLVDGEPQGELPIELRLEVGPHQIEVLKPGFRRFEQWIEVTEAAPVKLVARLERSGGGDGDGRSSGGGTRRSGIEVIAGAGLELGWRSFRYAEPMTATARPFDADAVPLAHVDVEVRPLPGRGRLAGLGIGLDAALGFPPAADTPAGDTIDTSWTELALELRYRHLVDRAIELGATAGFGRTAFGFGGDGALVDEAPTADYRYLRLAAGIGVHQGKLWARVGAAYLAPLSLGPLAERFRAASARGLAAVATASLRVRPMVDAALTLALRHWSWDFASEPGDAVIASGGTDRYLGLLIGAAYRF